MSNLNYSHFWARKMQHVCEAYRQFPYYLRRPLLLIWYFFLLFFQTAISANTILWIVSKFLAARSSLRLILSCRRLQSSSQCMLSIAQYCLVIWLSSSALLSRLEMYSLCSDVLLLSDFFSVDVSISITVKWPFHFSLSTISSSPRYMRHILDSILPCSKYGPSL